jgi:hypothetical protein
MKRLGLLLVLVAGCEPTDPPRSLAWKVTTANETIVSLAHSFEAEIRRDGCLGVITHREAFLAMEVAMTPPVLEPGVYAFVARARDRDCGVVGTGCTMVTLPTEDECVEVVLETPASRSECPPEATCEAGQCIFPDAGIPDGSIPDTPVPDTSPADSAPVDTGVIADTSTPDTGTPDTAMPECVRDDECDDDNPCTTDRCQAGGCSNADATGSCEDGMFCNGSDSCVGGSCVHSGDPCTGSCSETLDACGSECPEFVSAGRYCYGGTVVAEVDDPTDCVAFCENASFTTGQPVNCCERISGAGFPPAACSARAGASIATTTLTRSSAVTCTASF